MKNYSVFVCHGNGKHAGAGWKGNISLRYHTYLIWRGNDLMDVGLAAYQDSLLPGGRKKLQFIDVQEDSSHDPLLELEVAGGKRSSKGE